MTIIASINTIGVMRATEMLQAARADAAFDRRDGPHTVSIEIARLSELDARKREFKWVAAPSQRRVVDIRV